MLFREDLAVVDAGWRRVPLEAGFDPGEEALPGMHRRVSFESPVVPEESGYIYVWVSNESEDTEMWFDDLKVTHTGTFVAQATDYGAWGDVLREQRTDERKYRFGYQGQFAEKDEETGWNHFELREYDAVVGRWTSKDPARQFNTPYVGMGNNPVSSVDPDGAHVPGAGFWTNLFKSDERIWAERYAKAWSSDYVDYFAYKAGDAWGVYAVDKLWIDGGRQRYSTFTSVNSDGSLGAADGWFESWMPATGQVDFDPMTQLTLGFIAVNGSVAIGASTLRVSTAVGRSLFWSGVRSSAAAEFAAANGLTTLEMTTAGSFLNATQRAVLPIFRNSLWRSVSARFASKASGEVFAFSGYSVRTGSVWMQVERQILMNNSRVTGIHFISGF